MFAAFPDYVVEPCRHKAAGNAYDKWSNDSFLHKIHLPRCRGIPMVRGRGKNSIAQKSHNVRALWTKNYTFGSARHGDSIAKAITQDVKEYHNFTTSREPT